MRAGLDARIAEKDWWNAAQSATNLSELSLTLDDLKQAVAAARQTRIARVVSSPDPPSPAVAAA